MSERDRLIKVLSLAEMIQVVGGGIGDVPSLLLPLVTVGTGPSGSSSGGGDTGLGGDFSGGGPNPLPPNYVIPQVPPLIPPP